MKSKTVTKYVDREVQVPILPYWMPEVKFVPGTTVFCVEHNYANQVEVRCVFCGGTGGVIADSKPKQCPVCAGAGLKRISDPAWYIVPHVIKTVEIYAQNIRSYGVVKYYAVERAHATSGEIRIENTFASEEEARAEIARRTAPPAPPREEKA